MSIAELKQRDLTETIIECLKEHEVLICDRNENKARMYLIEVSAHSGPVKDFMDTYKEDVDPFQERLADKLFSQVGPTQTYGVLIDAKLNYKFAFNRKFAELKQEKGDSKSIAFKSAQNILLELSGKPSKEGAILPAFNEPGNDFSTAIRYSLQGRKTAQAGGEYPRELKFDKPSLLDRVKESYGKNAVELRFDKKSSLPFFLVEISYKTDSFKDFIRTYKKDIDEFKQNIAKNLFGKEKVENQYGLLVNRDMQIVYAFNTAFAHYDRKSESVVYAPAEEILANLAKGRTLTPPAPTRRAHKTQHRRPGGSTVYKYALQGKK